jgi:predicted  nucleic acid-binding Zn-ribbon protein
VHDYKQAVVTLQRELEESKRKGAELQQIIAGLNSTTIQPGGNLTDSQFVEGSPSSDNVAENVKDAHIKHLERKVTVLQANLYKSDGWTNRVGNSMKERDKAVDEVTRLTNQIKNLEGDNQLMQQRIDMLSAKLLEEQQKIRQVTEELQGQAYNKQMVLYLQDEVQRQRSEISTLKQSITQLDQENKSLKDLGYEANGQSVGNMACSLELEHLHSVVDKLKDIVLDQREYLLQLKKPTNNKSVRSLSSSASHGSGGGGNRWQELAAGRNASPTLRAPGCDVALGNLSQQAGLGQFNQAVGLKDLLDLKNSVKKNLSTPDFCQGEVAGTRRKPSSQEIMDDVFNLEDLNHTHILMSQGEMYMAAEAKPEPNIGGGSYLAENVHYRPQELFRQHGSGDLAGKSAAQLGPTPVSVSGKSPLHRATKSEVLAHRDSQEKLAIANWGTKSEIIMRKPWNSQSDNRSPRLTYKPDGSDVDKFGEANPGLTINSRQRHVAAYQGQTEPGKPVRDFISDTQRQMLFDNSAAAQYENVSRNSPTLQQQQLIYHPPGKQSSAQASAHNELKTGVKQAAPRSPAPCGPSQRPSQDVLYVNTSSCQSSSTPISSSPVDLESSRVKTNSDRLCPVCSHIYKNVSIEDFQTHVLDCFEDENPPETMKPQSSPNRLCPMMCGAKFGPETSQAVFENHVHSHFSEDCIAENFEMLS